MRWGSWSPRARSPISGSATRPPFQGANLAANRSRFAPLTELAAAKGITTAQLALAWLLHQGPDVVPVPGTRSPDRVRENAAAAAVPLDDDDLRRIEEVAPPGAAVGAALL